MTDAAAIVWAYTHLLFVTVQDISLAAMLAALGAPNVLISHFPPVNPMMAGLLALSHSTYLVVKAAPVPAKTPLDRK